MSSSIKELPGLTHSQHSKGGILLMLHVSFICFFLSVKVDLRIFVVLIRAYRGQLRKGEQEEMLVETNGWK